MQSMIWQPPKFSGVVGSFLISSTPSQNNRRRWSFCIGVTKYSCILFVFRWWDDSLTNCPSDRPKSQPASNSSFSGTARLWIFTFINQSIYQPVQHCFRQQDSSIKLKYRTVLVQSVLNYSARTDYMFCRCFIYLFIYRTCLFLTVPLKINYYLRMYRTHLAQYSALDLWVETITLKLVLRYPNERCCFKQFWGESVTIGLPHLQSSHKHSEMVSRIATPMWKDYVTITPLRRVKICEASI